MLKKLYRANRLERSLHKEIAVIIRHYLKDPRLNALITVSEVKVSSDLGYAKIFITFLNHEDVDYIKLVLGILHNSSGFIRAQLNQHIYLRIVPKLLFIHDISFIKGMKISRLIHSSRKK
ncbi:30S ribosome-binding factor RbfA [Buchnera aphidicola]|uniref:30S ribosome-binding factor RbfA n=1 Tax=Buchnera aphidicola TaxID=9 RepID=UPI00094C26DC|nr:30S ribosome-binding factor RbfA [Buchnera aphidicola]